VKVITDPEKELRDQEVIVTIGVFDGVHRGHQELFRQASRIKEEMNIGILVITFFPHPRSLVGDFEDSFLTPPGEKIALIGDLGVDYYWAIAFTKELSSLMPLAFAEEYLCQKIRTKHVVCGFNFTFGHKGMGKPQDLVKWCRKLGFGVTVVPPYTIKNEIVSSSKIRDYLSRGLVEKAWEYLGRPYCVYGKVTKGNGRGKKIGFPTSNINIPQDKFLPQNGVYAAWVRVAMTDGNQYSVDLGRKIHRRVKSVLGSCVHNDRHLLKKMRMVTRPAVVNIGTRPTFGGVHTRVEVHIPGFCGNLYGDNMQVFFVKRLREERKFDSWQALRRQIKDDVETAMESLVPNQRSGSDDVSFTLVKAYDRIFHANLPWDSG